MTVRKISISLDERSLLIVDREVQAGRFASRSSGIESAIRLLADSRLADEYAAASREWDEVDWDVVVNDGLAS